MEILCHRGWWTTPAERNAMTALERALTAGHGVETDLRDASGRIVISHDPPAACAHPPGLADLLRLHAAAPQAPLALNVKADGLAGPVANALAEAGLGEALAAGRVYAFDASVPDTLAWLRAGVPVFTRHSDVEPDPVLYRQASGVWLDDFGPSRWWDAATVAGHLAAGKQVAVVSPELHGRDHRDAWDALLHPDLAGARGLALCTDRPAEALEVFSCTR